MCGKIWLYFALVSTAGQSTKRLGNWGRYFETYPKIPRNQATLYANYLHRSLKF